MGRLGGPLFGAELARQGAVGAAGGTFPGFGSAPPAVGNASSPGVTGVVSDAGHTHAGVSSVAAGDARVSVGGTATAPTVAQRIVAAWTVGTASRRYFAVDGVNGNDASAGFSDVSMAAAGAVAKRTIAGLAAIIPPIGAGRACEIAIAAGTYAEDLLGLLNGLCGYAAGFPIVRGTGTNATAGATAFAGDTADCTYLGATTAAGLNAAGYNPTGAPSTTSMQSLKVGGGAPGFAGEPASPLHLRLRFDSASSTAALRNVCRDIAIVSGGDTLTWQLALPATPAAADVFYVERPGVVLNGGTLMGGPQGNISGGGVRGLQFAGIRFATAVVYSVVGVEHAFCEFVGSIACSNCHLGMRDTYAHPLGTLRVGGTHGATQITSNRGGSYELHFCAFETFGQFTEPQTFSAKDGAVFGTGLLVCGTSGTDATFVDSIGPTQSEAQLALRILGSNATFGAGLTLNSGAFRVGAVDVSGAGARPAIKLSAAIVTQLTSAGLTGSTGNTDVGVSVSEGSILNTNGVTNTVSGVTGDVRLVGGSFIVSWTQLGLTGVVDLQGCRIISGTPPMSPVMFTGKLTSGVAAVHTYCACSDAAAANVANPFLFPQALRVARRLRVFVQGALGVTTTFTVYRGGVATALTCTVAAGASIGLDDTAAHAVLFSDGDQLDLRADAPIDGVDPGNLTFAAVVEFLS